MKMNLLEMCLPVITNIVDPCEFEYCQCTGDTVNEFGVVETTYTPWMKCLGSVQPMDASMMEMNDLDKAKHGILVWGSIPIRTVGDRNHPDYVRWLGKIYIVDRDTYWYQANGWTSVSCVELVDPPPGLLS